MLTAVSVGHSFETRGPAATLCVLTLASAATLASPTHRVIDAPHEDAEDGVAGSEHLHLLLHKVLLLGLGFGRQDHHGAGGGPGVAEGRHDHRPTVLVLSSSCPRGDASC